LWPGISTPQSQSPLPRRIFRAARRFPQADGFAEPAISVRGRVANPKLHANRFTIGTIGDTGHWTHALVGGLPAPPPPLAAWEHLGNINVTPLSEEICSGKHNSKIHTANTS